MIEMQKPEGKKIKNITARPLPRCVCSLWMHFAAQHSHRIYSHHQSWFHVLVQLTFTSFLALTPCALLKLRRVQLEGNHFTASHRIPSTTSTEQGGKKQRETTQTGCLIQGIAGGGGIGWRRNPSRGQQQKKYNSISFLYYSVLIFLLAFGETSVRI